MGRESWATNRLVAYEALARSRSGGAGPVPPTVETVEQVPFTFATPSPLVLQAVTPGQLLNRVTIAITVPFNGPGALLTLGTTAAPAGIISLNDTVISFPGQQYTTEDLFPFLAADFLQLTIHSSGSTQGSGYLLYKLK
jgi:hypothetical protein